MTNATLNLMLTRDDPVRISFARAEKLAAIKLAPAWEAAFLQWHGAREVLDRLQYLAENARDEAHKEHLWWAERDLLVAQTALSECESVGRRIFRAAIAAGDLVIRTSAAEVVKSPAGHRLADTDAALASPKQTDWINGAAGPLALLDGMVVTTYFLVQDFDAWLKKAMGTDSPKPTRRTREKQVTRQLLRENYKPDGNIGLSTPDEVAAKLLTLMEISGAPPPAGTRKKQIEAISKRVERDQKEMGFR